MKIHIHDYKLDYDDSDIRYIAQTFAEWRYFYEKNKSINIIVLEAFFNSLKDPSIALPHTE